MIAGFVQVNLAEMISEIGEDRVKAILSDFSCPLNKDVEFYIRQLYLRNRVGQRRI